MAIALLLLPGGAEISLGPDTTALLARFGITHAFLLGDREHVAVVLEGWAFDPDRSAAELVDLLGRGRTTSRVLRSMADVAVPPSPGDPDPHHRQLRQRREEP
jgi:hypothetical protein